MDPIDLVWVSGIVFKHVTECLVLDRLGLFFRTCLFWIVGWESLVHCIVD